MPVAIPSIFVLAFGGVTLFPLDPVASFLVWGIAFAWLMGMIWYLPQRVYVHEAKCHLDVPLEKRSQEQLYVTVEGFIKSRHKDSLKTILLNLAKDTLSPINSVSRVPSVLNSYYQEFSAVFDVQFDMLKAGREGQKQGEMVDLATMSILLPSNEWATMPFTIPNGKMPPKLKRTTKKGKQVRGMG